MLPLEMRESVCGSLKLRVPSAVFDQPVPGHRRLLCRKEPPPGAESGQGDGERSPGVLLGNPEGLTAPLRSSNSNKP